MKAYIIEDLKSSSNVRVGENVLTVNFANKEEDVLGYMVVVKNKTKAKKLFGKNTKFIEISIPKQ